MIGIIASLILAATATYLTFRVASHIDVFFDLLTGQWSRSLVIRLAKFIVGMTLAFILLLLCTYMMS